MSESAQIHSYYKNRWQLEFVWVPKICSITGRVLWLEHAYRGSIVIVYRDQPREEYRWHSKNEHLIWSLNQT